MQQRNQPLRKENFLVESKDVPNLLTNPWVGALFPLIMPLTHGAQADMRQGKAEFVCASPAIESGRRTTSPMICIEIQFHFSQGVYQKKVDRR
jgi:hypothetical protein